MSLLFRAPEIVNETQGLIPKRNLNLMVAGNNWKTESGLWDFLKIVLLKQSFHNFMHCNLIQLDDF